MLWAAQVFVFLSVLVVLGSTWYSQSDHGRIKPEKFGLELADLPPGQGLTLRRQKGSSKAESCKGFGAVKDEYFAQYGGVYCGDLTFEAPSQAAPALSEGTPQPLNPVAVVPGTGAMQVQKVMMTYKTFDSDTNAAEYTWRFWGMHCHDPIPMVAMSDVTAGMQTVGSTPHVLFWDPSRMAWPLSTPIPEVAFGKTVIVVFRSGRTFVKLHFIGQPRQFAIDLTPAFAAKLADVVALRIQTFTPTFAASFARRMSTSIHRLVNAADKQAIRTAKMLFNKATSPLQQVFSSSSSSSTATNTPPSSAGPLTQRVGVDVAVAAAKAFSATVEEPIVVDLPVSDNEVVANESDEEVHLDLGEAVQLEEPFVEITNGSGDKTEDIDSDELGAHWDWEEQPTQTIKGGDLTTYYALLVLFVMGMSVFMSNFDLNIQITSK
jgi:hypothetical protein